MAERKTRVRELRVSDEVDYRAPQVGEICEVDEDGRARVSFRGNLLVPVEARSVLDAAPRAGEPIDSLVGAPVLLMFEDGDPARPIIVGLLRETLQPEPVRPELSLDLGKNRDVVIDGQRLTFDAKEEIVLRCGKSIIYLTRSGKVLIRGAKLISRASETNRIKGGSVSIN